MFPVQVKRTALDLLLGLQLGLEILAALGKCINHCVDETTTIVKTSRKS